MRRLIVALTAFVVVGAGCGNDTESGTVTLLTHDSFDVGEEILAEFTAETGWRVEVLAGGDAGQVLNQAILAAGNPVADVLFGVDNTFLSRALDAELFLEYRSRRIDTVAPGLDLDPHVTPIDFGDVCINIDRTAFATPPSTLEELTDPAFAGTLVVENPATSSPGLAFLLVTVAVFGESGDTTWRDFWQGLVANDVAVTAGWEDAYYGVFSGGSGAGDRPLVVSYASSPPVAGILRGTDDRQGAEALIDFMLSRSFQEDIPLRMFVFPASTEATLPEVFAQHTAVPDEPVLMDPEIIEANRERWIREWTDIVLR
jgi:thiamine transport system substrate-binding protein